MKASRDNTDASVIPATTGEDPNAAVEIAFETSNASIETAAKDLISKLDGDFQAEGKRSCQDCLRSKALPCSTVREIIANHVEDKRIRRGSYPTIFGVPGTLVLRKAHEILLATHTNFTTSTVDPSRSLSSMDCINQLSLGLRYIQFLVAMTPEEGQKSLPTTKATATNMSLAEVNSMMGSFLLAWIQGVRQLLRQNESPSDGEEHPWTADATQSFDRGPVVCYAFASLLRMNNEYTPQRGALLVPLWKGLCDLAEESENRLPMNWIADALRALGGFLKEGNQRLEVEAWKQWERVIHKNTNANTNGIASIAFQGKVVGFMVARISNLFGVYCSRRTAEDAELEPWEHDMWTSLLGLRGLATSLQLLSSTKGIELDVGVLRVYCELAAKVGKAVMGILVIDSPPNQKRRFAIEALQSLLRSQIKHGDGLGALGGTIGKVLVLQQVLLRVANTKTNTSSLPLSDWENQETIEALLATIETLHSSAIPQCFYACTIAIRCVSGGSGTLINTIVHASLQSMLLALETIESSQEFIDSPKADALQRLLIRWLDAGKIGDREETPQHPLSRELVLLLLHAHILHENRFAQDDSNGTKRKIKLLTYLSRLLMDVRSSDSLRRNIGALFIRLQSSGAGAEAFSEVSDELLEREWVSWLKHHPQPTRIPSSRKRPRCFRDGTYSGPSIDADLEAVSVIARVMRCSTTGGLMATASFPLELCNEIEWLVMACQSYMVDPQKNLESFATFAGRKALVIAWIERCVLSTKNPTDLSQTFQAKTGKDFFQDALLPIMSAVSNLRFQPEGGGSVFREEKAILYTATMRLFGSVITVFGNHRDTNLPIDHACALIKHAIPKEWRSQRGPRRDAWNWDKYSAGVLFQAVNSLGIIAVAIPEVCPGKILKTIQKNFVGLLSSADWAVVSEGIVSVISFGESVAVAHQSMLGDCLPDCIQGHFEARVSGRIWMGERSITLEERQREATIHRSNGNAGTVHGMHSDDRGYACRQIIIRGILPAATTIRTIAPGSYILEMPTQEDRNALVIFPPGNQSLKDIRYMLGSEEEENPEIAPSYPVLKHAMAIPDGGFRISMVQSLHKNKTRHGAP